MQTVRILLLSLVSLTAAQAAPGATFVQRTLHPSATPGRARLVVHAGLRAPYRIPRLITGKFAEHLGWNIYKGMDAQILLNPTFGDYPFATGRMSPDGVAVFECNPTRIHASLRRLASGFGWPKDSLAGLVEAYQDGLAAFWTRVGSRSAVHVSPDTGPVGGRAQRIQVQAAGQGVAQWTWLPMQRTRQYEFAVYGRAPRPVRLRVSISASGATHPAVTVTIPGSLKNQWGRLTGRLEVPSTVPPDQPVRVALTAASPGQFVIRYFFLRPSDQINGADPDIVRFLRESHLPILRWPGGNFSSGYHWEDGVGPIANRPTRPNYAWGGIEPNTFGTDEYMAFCRAVGCDPLICVNAGDGTPPEAARWVQYCNGSTNTPMGAWRAANGHPAPYHVKYWEVGNELWGRWQDHWTTASGYVDRLRRFVQAMRQADPNIQLFACGAPVFWGKKWNDTLIADAPHLFHRITDHPLIGGTVSPTISPLDVYRDFMAVPEVLEQKWAALRETMQQGGIRHPRLAITELQLFAHLGSTAGVSGPIRLTRANMIRQSSITEAVYDVLIYQACIRLGSFVELVTHSAVVNHGGGLRKRHQRVYANPCYYAQAAFTAFANATPVAEDLTCAMDQAPRVLPDLRNATPSAQYSDVDALAALAPNGDLLLSLVNRRVSGPVRLEVELPGFANRGHAAVQMLSAKEPWLGNTLNDPKAVVPVDSTLTVHNDTFTMTLPPFAVTRVRIPKAD